METGKGPASGPKKTPFTPKAIIYQRFGTKACYKVEEVQEVVQNGCPGLAIPQKGPCLYRCSLQLPEFSVVSETFKRKKDAEQSAAEKAIQELGIQPKEDNLTVEQAWNELTARLSYLFSIEFLSAIHPLSGHFRAALAREGHLNGFIPVAAIATFDAKTNSLCKYINSEVESNHLLVMSLIIEAAKRLADTLFFSEEKLSLKRLTPHPPEIIQSLLNKSNLPESISIEAVRIPSSTKQTVESLMLNASFGNYYLDAIAKELGVEDASKIMISRTIGKASSEMRLYFCAPESITIGPSSELYMKQASSFKVYSNAVATYLSGQEICGDAILASVGYTWKSTDLFYEDLPLRAYYRILANKIPSGIYKLSREAMLAAELPTAFTTRSNWRGSVPRDILFTFCRHHRLSEPVFSSDSIEPLPDLPGRKRLRDAASGGNETNEGGLAATAVAQEGCTLVYRCTVKIYSKCQDLILLCSPKESYKKQNDAIHNAALKVLLWLDRFLDKVDMSVEEMTSSAKGFDILIYPQQFVKEFSLCQILPKYRWSSATVAGSFLCPSYSNVQNNNLEDEASSGMTPSSGSLVCVTYNIYLATEKECIKEHLEGSKEFEFEIGSGAVSPVLEAVVTQMSVDQSACFTMELPSKEILLAVAHDSANILSLLSSGTCLMKCEVTLLRVTVPLEDRMEQALFSPPLSKQRVEYALQHIRESSASSLVDFGCGSGSLLESLLAYQTSLDKIVGVDISQRALARAAKILHSKLNGNTEAEQPTNGIKSAILYKGSILTCDSRLCGYDIATCLEVIEHMEEHDACSFGDIVLSSFCPQLLIVSTPNYEYNVILQKSTPQYQEEDPDEKSQQQSCKFRNHDHKFEWTRQQFCQWASDLALRHNYDVEFSGVGGELNKEPGFASQIAVFRRRDSSPVNADFTEHYDVIWEWSSSNNSRS
ncbi:small RNA 2'-O-methyltransferase-like [Lycium ferocissimum]|uniref:small RNA 2'-O-methyltransferase-like n=1 Tax=Lycium ferocissimum TaxID=112874 RepID=UPI002815CED2|nr:small RNA 2'-O-methyltransferase-like [Lycium ferocissimum]XP_059288748.1 small RNA 2'-O-methyltransferase-like [Lycium ferocissimum]